MKRKFTFSSLVIILLLLGMAAVTVYPFVYMLSVSLSSDVYVLKNQITLMPMGLNFRAYNVVFKDPRIWSAYSNTILYLLIGTPISLIITAAGAFALSKKDMLFNKPFTLLIVFTMFFNGGMIPTFLIVKSLGLVDTIWAMVIPTAVSTWNLIIMRTFFSAIPKELEESGKLDGLTNIGIFIRIALPLSTAALATIGLFYAVGIWNNFYSALLYLRTESLYPMQVVLRNIVMGSQMINNGASNVGDDQVLDEPLKYATIMVSTIPILLIYPFLQKYFVKGALIGSVKG
ncbi:carbohydrate ABC transporter permease [Paenibacillus sp. GP183]|uniref:carbohydrate ABC transporter permease n=1 Tax=Paenibacillus sp. GP183 TaxID=1882751 RepID=UPI0008949B1A|nr:carbohydrate ABC transporter permease [Paenibacillus sp. GP183]SEC77492.1 carbohydrate ABC transporter membrane protein 2, CUT1 family [Paenibacillus sp. GP183]